MLIFIALSLLLPVSVGAPKIPLFQEDRLILIEGNSLVSRQSSVFCNDLEGYLWETADKYNVDYEKMWNLIQCESAWNPQAEGDEGKAFGLLQFHKPTFEFYCDKYKHSDYSYYNPENQITLAVEMISNGLGKEHWKNCSQQLKN